MILNSYAVLVVFVAILQMIFSLTVLIMGAIQFHAPLRQVTPDGRSALESRSYLVFLLAIALIVVNLVSWPLLYFLWQSYVPEWPGVMCIYGVTQIGEGSIGPSRFLPALVRMLQIGKPLLVFAGGAWFVLYVLNRQTATAPLLRRLMIALMPLGFFGAVDAAAQCAYVVIPKAEEFPPAGCCVVEDEESRFVPPMLVGEAGKPWLYAGYYGGNITLILALGWVARGQGMPGPFAIGSLLLLAVVVFAASALFLVQTAGPTLIHRPYHHCVYDLIPEVPEAMVAIGLFFAGFFSLGWAGVLWVFGRAPATKPFMANMTRGLIRLSLMTYLASLVMCSLELVLAYR